MTSLSCLITMFKLFAKQLCSLFSVHPPTIPVPVSDNFSSLLTADLCTNTDAFLTVYRDGVSQSSDPISALTRFSVEELTADKNKTFPQHKFISVRVKDQETEQSYNFFIERNSFKSELRASTTSPLTKNLTSASPTSTSAIETGAPQSSKTPLLTLNTPSEFITSYLPLTGPFHSKSQYSLRDKYSIIPAQIMPSSITSFESVAEGRILGRGMFLKDGMGGSHREIGFVRQIRPIGLSLFELGIIIDVIHNEEPDHCVFENQDCWFLNTILVVVELLFNDNLNGMPDNMALDDYLPNLAGLGMNTLTIDPKNGLLHKIANRYLERRNKEFSKVCVFAFFDSFISNYLKGTR